MSPLSLNSYKNNIWAILLILFIPLGSISAQQILLPVEVLGDEGTIETRNFDLSIDEASQADRLWLQVNNLSYENKGSIKINNEAWLTLNHQTVNMQAQEKARGGMVHGGFNTIRFSIPATGITSGANTISFRFDLCDGISMGYRVIRFNLLDEKNTKILNENRFIQDDPEAWVAPFTDAASIAEGKDLWYNAPLISNPLPEGRKGFWYGHELPAGRTMNATCSSCHAQDGRDLEMFSYSNHSIIERVKFHQLSQEEAEKITSYIRSLSNEHEEINRAGRPWNPPYQPGPSLDTVPIEKWAAGAGLDAVLDKDEDMLPYMFPDGVTQETVYERFDSDKTNDRTLIPLSIQFPDWKHWLPIVHPMDAYNKNNYFLSESTGPNNPHKNYQEVREYLETNAPSGFPNKAELKDKIHRLHNHFRFFVQQGATVNEHWRSSDGDATKNLNDGIPRELAATSLARLFAVKNFEFVTEFDLQDKASEFGNPEDQFQPRQWPGNEYNVFEVPPHFQACVDNNCNQFMGQPTETGMYESTNWYQLQMVINGGDGDMSHNSPVDYNYHPDFITKSSNSSGIYEPLRYYHSMNVMYQTRTWSGGLSPNTGKGFRIRVMGPWNIYGITDGNQFNGFAPGEFAKLLDDIEPGMTAWVMNAMLRQFLTEVQKPYNSLDIWNRSPDGGDNELDRADKTYADIIDAVERTERQETFFVHYAAKMYYYIPRFQQLGVDCEIMEEIIDWCQEAWPLIDWHVFSNHGEMQLQLALDDPNFCSETNVIKAIATNADENTIYNWTINGNASPNTGNEFSTENVSPGDIIACQISSGRTCLLDNSVDALFTMPNSTNEFTMLLDGASNHVPLATTIACENDEIELKLNIDLQPKMWLDAMDVNEGDEPTNNSLISSWNDKSGNGFIAEATNNDLRPKYISNAMNGLPAVVFGSDNNADGLELFNITEDDFMDNDWTIIFVGEAQKPDGNGDWRDIIGNKTEGSNGWFFRFGNSARVQVGVGPNLEHGQNYDFNRSFIVEITKNGDEISTYLNGRSDRKITREDEVTMTINNALYLGQASGGNPNINRYHKGPISELMVFEHAISKTERAFLEGYLTNKWRLNDELAYTHPYFQYSPFNFKLHAPDGAEVEYDPIQTDHVLQLNTANKFGNYSIIKSVCGSEILDFNIINGNAAGNITTFSINSGPFETGSSITSYPGANIQLAVDNAFNGTYQWEAPSGILISENTNPDFSLNETEHTGIWKLHTYGGQCNTNLTHEFTINVNIQSPFNGTAHVIPGTIQAEEFDFGGEGIAFHEETPTNLGGSYRGSEAVDIQNTGDNSGLYNVGWTDNGEWLEYSVFAEEDSIYNFTFRVATPNDNTSFHVDIDGTTVTSELQVGSTGDWQGYYDLIVNSIALSQGNHVLRFAVDRGGFNFNFLTASYAPTDCHGDANGLADYDICNECRGGNTGEDPITDPANCVISGVSTINDDAIAVIPNPYTSGFTIALPDNEHANVVIVGVDGKIQQQATNYQGEILGTELSTGVHLVKIVYTDRVVIRSILKR